MGFPALDFSEPIAWWTPSEYAVRLASCGVDMDLCAPGPHWLPNLPERYVSRPIWCGRLDDIDKAPRSGFAKMAEAKLSGLDSRWWDSIEDFVLSAMDAGAVMKAWVQVCPVFVGYEQEHRCFVRNGHVVASSVYMADAGEEIWQPQISDNPLYSKHADDARSFAQEVADFLGHDQPVSYVIDVGLASKRWSVIEANPTWCAGMYDCDLFEVAASVVSSSLTVAGRSQSAHGRWTYVPDPSLVAIAEKKIPLRASICRYVT